MSGWWLLLPEFFKGCDVQVRRGSLGQNVTRNKMNSKEKLCFNWPNKNFSKPPGIVQLLKKIALLIINGVSQRLIWNLTEPLPASYMKINKPSAQFLGFFQTLVLLVFTDLKWMLGKNTGYIQLICCRHGLKRSYITWTRTARHNRSPQLSPVLEKQLLRPMLKYRIRYVSYLYLARFWLNSSTTANLF